MKSLIKRILIEEFEEGIPKLIAAYFKHIHSMKPKNVKELKELMKETLPMIGKNAKDLSLYYLLYRANYRKDGRFDLITKDEFIGPEDLPAKTIKNSEANQFVAKKIPFKGSNLEGKWEKDGRGVKQYVVISFGWYPIFIFKEDQWYMNDEPYSSSTSKQIYKSKPLEYTDPQFGVKLIVLTRKEMEQLRSILSRDEIIKLKKEKLVKSKPELTKRSQRFGFYTGDWHNKLQVKYKIIDSEINDDKVILKVKIIDAIKGNESILSQISNTEKAKIKNGIYNEIIRKYRGLVGSGQYNWGYLRGEEGDENNEIKYDIPKNLIFDIKFED